MAADPLSLTIACDPAFQSCEGALVSYPSDASDSVPLADEAALLSDPRLETNYSSTETRLSYEARPTGALGYFRPAPLADLESRVEQRPPTFSPMLEPGKFYPLSENFSLLPEPLQDFMAGLRANTNIGFTMGRAVTPEGIEIPQISFRVMEGGTPLQVTSGGKVPTPEIQPTGVAVPLFYAGIPIALVFVDQQLVKMGIPQKATMPLMLSTAFVATSIGAWRGWNNPWHWGKIIGQDMPLFFSYQILANLFLQSIGVEAGSDAQVYGSVVLATTPFVVARLCPRVGVGIKAVSRVLGPVGVVAMINYASGLVADGIAWVAGDSEDPEYQLRKFISEQKQLRAFTDEGEEPDWMDQLQSAVIGNISQGVLGWMKFFSDDVDAVIEGSYAYHINQYVESIDEFTNSVDETLITLALQNVKDGIVDWTAVNQGLFTFYAEHLSDVDNAYRLIELVQHRPEASRGVKLARLATKFGSVRSDEALREYLKEILPETIQRKTERRLELASRLRMYHLRDGEVIQDENFDPEHPTEMQALFVQGKTERVEDLELRARLILKGKLNYGYGRVEFVQPDGRITGYASIGGMRFYYGEGSTLTGQLMTYPQLLRLL